MNCEKCGQPVVEKPVETKKIKIQIKHWITGSILFEYEKENNTLVDTIKKANLRGADLYGADLRGADLYGADLYEADLYGADLSGADLRGADLRGADLYGADLYEADLYGADLREADLMATKFYGKGGTKKLTKEQLPDFLNALGFQVE